MNELNTLFAIIYLIKTDDKFNYVKFFNEKQLKFNFNQLY